MPNKSAATLIRREMKARDLSMSWVARRMGVSRQYLSLILNPPYEVSEDQAARILEAVQAVAKIKLRGRKKVSS